MLQQTNLQNPNQSNRRSAIQLLPLTKGNIAIASIDQSAFTDAELSRKVETRLGDFLFLKFRIGTYCEIQNRLFNLFGVSK